MSSKDIIMHNTTDGGQTYVELHPYTKTRNVIDENGKNVDQKINDVQNVIDSHANDSDIHVTAQKQYEWDAKETPDGAQTKADNVRTYVDNNFAKLSTSNVFKKAQTIEDSYARLSLRKSQGSPFDSVAIVAYDHGTTWTDAALSFNFDDIAWKIGGNKIYHEGNLPDPAQMSDVNAAEQNAKNASVSKTSDSIINADIYFNNGTENKAHILKGGAAWFAGGIEVGFGIKRDGFEVWDGGNLPNPAQMSDVNAAEQNAKDASVNKIADYTSEGIDPDTTTSAFILTNHANKPPGGSHWYYIRTMFYALPSSGGNRSQTAQGYNNHELWVRYYYNDSWSDWRELPVYTTNDNLNIKKAVSTNITTGNQQVFSTIADRIYLGNPQTNLRFESNGTPRVNISGGNTYDMWHKGNQVVSATQPTNPSVGDIWIQT